ncbi:Hypothetical protein SMAX5B_007170 [Scophthalmus maximus]|uniref:Uncharacterized protein n=1 Tax=Scophthalmus maximus TaxID=52904 RepID=A0A2U9BIG2_SCOMX|nr:Hypothetical protein SMAX5B_007170 [Scophthalmus maximus]
MAAEEQDDAALLVLIYQHLKVNGFQRAAKGLEKHVARSAPVEASAEATNGSCDCEEAAEDGSSTEHVELDDEPKQETDAAADAAADTTADTTADVAADVTPASEQAAVGQTEATPPSTQEVEDEEVDAAETSAQAEPPAAEQTNDQPAESEAPPPAGRNNQ